jgi:hypothetical protein
VLILTSNPCRCGTPTTARRYIRQHRAWHSVCLYSLPCHVTRRYATTLSFTTSLHDSTTTINDPQQRPQQTDPRLSFTSIPRPRAAAIEARVTFIFFTHEGSGTHFCPFLVDLAPYPYRSENKRKLLLQVAGIMQAQTMRDGTDSCRTPLRFP